MTMFTECSLKDAGNYYGSNSRGRANHSKSLGWNPKLTTKDMLASIEVEVKAILGK